MTEQEFLALPNDQKNALVAEHAMRWRTRWTEKKDGRRPTGYYRLWVKKDDRPGGWFLCPTFCGLMTEAWAALKAFEATCDPNRTSIHPCGNGQDGLWWAVYYDDQMIANHTDFAMALCIYALKTVGVIEEVAA